ncbi:MAG: hypothetical protein V3V74_07805 [Nitrosomonadaceae bacterium]
MNQRLIKAYFSLIRTQLKDDDEAINDMISKLEAMKGRQAHIMKTLEDIENEVMDN